MNQRKQVMMELQRLEKKLQTQELKASMHAEHLKQWFSQHVILISVGFFTGFGVFFWLKAKTHQLKFSSVLLEQMTAVLLVGMRLVKSKTLQKALGF